MIFQVVFFFGCKNNEVIERPAPEALVQPTTSQPFGPWSLPFSILADTPDTPCAKFVALVTSCV